MYQNSKDRRISLLTIAAITILGISTTTNAQDIADFQIETEGSKVLTSAYHSTCEYFGPDVDKVITCEVYPTEFDYDHDTPLMVLIYPKF